MHLRPRDSTECRSNDDSLYAIGSGGHVLTRPCGPHDRVKGGRSFTGDSCFDPSEDRPHGGGRRGTFFGGGDPMTRGGWAALSHNAFLALKRIFSSSAEDCVFKIVSFTRGFICFSESSMPRVFRAGFVHASIFMTCDTDLCQDFSGVFFLTLSPHSA